MYLDLKMSQSVDRETRCRRQEEVNRKQLQQIFEARGGKGPVEKFIEIGATDPEDGKNQHWGNMTEKEQQLWLDLANSGIDLVLLPSDFKNTNPYNLTIDKLLTLL